MADFLERPESLVYLNICRNYKRILFISRLATVMFRGTLYACVKVSLDIIEEYPLSFDIINSGNLLKSIFIL